MADFQKKWSRVFLNGRFAAVGTVSVSDKGSTRRVDGERNFDCALRREVCGPDQGPAAGRELLNGRLVKVEKEKALCVALWEPIHIPPMVTSSYFLFITLAPTSLLKKTSSKYEI